MEFQYFTDQEPSKYQFAFHKKSTYKKKTLLNVDSHGSISFLRQEEKEQKETLQYIFRILKYTQKNVQFPLLFTPVKWAYNTKLNITGIKNKEHHRLVWNKHRDKYRRPENMTIISAIERLYFHSPLGLEYDAFSNSIYLLFFLPLFNKDIQIETIIKGLDWHLTPLNIPVNTTYKCVDINDQHITFKGWISLDEKMLDELLRKDIFKNKAKKYHFSKDFQIDSDITLIIDCKTGLLYKADFNLDIRGEKEEVFESTNYNIFFENYSDGQDAYRTYDNKSFTKKEWEIFEEQEYQKYLQQTGKVSSIPQKPIEIKRSIFLDDNIPTKEYHYTVSQDTAKIYKYPSLASNVIAIIPNKTPINISVYKPNDWCEVILDKGNKGYVHSHFIQKHESKS